MRRATAVLALALCGAPATAREPVPTRVPLFARTLSFSLPPGIVLANNRSNGTNVLMEYVPSGETLANWTRLVTVQAYRGLGRSPMPTATIARQAFYPAACVIGRIYRDEGEQRLSNGIKRSVVANGCASLPAGAYPQALKGAGEQNFIYVFRDDESIFTLNYAVRGPSFAGRNPPVDPETAGLRLMQQFGIAEMR